VRWLSVVVMTGEAGVNVGVKFPEEAVPLELEWQNINIHDGVMKQV
jgi:hypothetical protein